MIAAGGAGEISMWNIGVPEGPLYQAESQYVNALVIICRVSAHIPIRCVARFHQRIQAPVNSVSWARDGNSFFSGGNDEKVYRWNYKQV